MKLPVYSIAIILIYMYISKGKARRSERVGCYRHKPMDGAMVAVKYPIVGMTVDKCREWCLNDTHSTYLGIEENFQCFCGDKGEIILDSDCNRPCPGNRSQICGGYKALSVYTVCPRGHFGASCTERCHCRDDEVCGRRSGFCPGGARYRCATGWQGERCSEDIDECAVDAVCGWDNNCTNTVGSYTCQCGEAYYLSRNLTTCLATSDLIYGNNLWRICVSAACVLGVIVIAILIHRLIGWYRERTAIVSGNQEPHEKNSAVRYNENVIAIEDYIPGNGLHDTLSVKDKDTQTQYEEYYIPSEENQATQTQYEEYHTLSEENQATQTQYEGYHTPSEEDQDTQTQYEELQALDEIDYEQPHGAGREENRNHNETKIKMI